MLLDVVVVCLFLEFLAIQRLFFFTLDYYHLLCQVCCENFTTSYELLMQVMLLTITILFMAPVFQPEYQQMDCDVKNS